MTTESKIYEVINPSDKVTIKSDNFLIAATATALGGEGYYGLKGLFEGGEVMPVFVLGGFDSWWKSQSEMEFGDFIDANMEAIAEVLDTAVTGNREAFEAGYKHALDKEAFRKDWEDGNRSSYTAIEKHFRGLAKHLRGKIKKDAA